MASSPAKIEVRELGNTGLKLSCVGFGALPRGHLFDPVSKDETIAAVREAFRRGINYFDTSPRFGDTLSENLLGITLKALGVPRHEYIVSTKCGLSFDGCGLSADRVAKSIDESLTRLQLDYVDILLCDVTKSGSLDQIVNETIPALQKLKEAGKVRFIGITGFPVEIFTSVLDRVPPGTVDVILSYCHYSINGSTLEDLQPYLKRKGVGVINASPLAIGIPTESDPPSWHPASPELKAAWQAAATSYWEEKGKNISTLAMQYSLSNKDISSVLVGMNSVRQVEENVAAALDLGTAGKYQETLSDFKAILKLVKNKTDAYQGVAHPARYDAPAVAPHPARYDAPAVAPAVAPAHCEGCPPQHTTPPPNRTRRFVNGCLAVICCCMRAGYNPLDLSCDEICQVDCF